MNFFCCSIFTAESGVLTPSNGQKIKVAGDVWGVPPLVGEKPDEFVKQDISFDTGDKVLFKSLSGKFLEGRIVGMKATSAIVEFVSSSGKVKKGKLPIKQ